MKKLKVKDISATNLRKGNSPANDFIPLNKIAGSDCFILNNISKRTDENFIQLEIIFKNHFLNHCK